MPTPVVRDWDHLIEICRLASIEEESRHLDGRTKSIGEMWAQERAHLLSLPGERFDSALRVTARVDAKGRVMVLRNRYSAPVMLTGCVVEAVVHSREVVIQHGGKEVGRHPRRYGVGGDRLVLDHSTRRRRLRTGTLRAFHYRRGARQRIARSARRTDAGSVIITTNLPFSEWTNVFSDPRLCKAVVERLTYRSHIVETGIESYRFKQSVNRHNGALRTTPRATSRTRAAHSANGPRNALPAASTT